jgi:CubicO group peptidase (beta-lactamase class C family)
LPSRKNISSTRVVSYHPVAGTRAQSNSTWLYHGPMLPRKLIAPALCLLTTIVLSSPPANAQIDDFHSRFDAALAQHGVVGGGFAFVHGKAPANELFAGEASRERRQRVDAETAYNWASITKTFTAIAILQLRD